MAPPDRSSPVDRRAALRVGGGALALVLGVGAGWLDRRDDETSAPPTAPSTTAATTATTDGPGTTIDLPGVTDVDPGILVVGARYLATHPDDADPEALLAALPPVDGDPTAAAAALVRSDFARGDTVVVDGWVLARSEARASAILALACNGAEC